MRINYYPDTDSLYIDLSHKPSVDSREISSGVMLDYDIDGASKKMEINEIVLGRLPLQTA